MNKGKQVKPYLVEKRNEFIWSLAEQEYSCADIGDMFNLSRSRIHTIITKKPKAWNSPWIKKNKVDKLENVIRQKLMISTYRAWVNLKARCDNPNTPQYKDYGGRGITYAPSWKKFESFLSDMGLKTDESLSIDRINNDGNYNKTNCRWATRIEQAANKRR